MSLSLNPTSNGESPPSVSQTVAWRTRSFIDPVTLRAGTGDGSIELVDVQPEGKSVQPATAWRNGAHLQASDRLG